MCKKHVIDVTPSPESEGAQVASEGVEKQLARKGSDAYTERQTDESVVGVIEMKSRNPARSGMYGYVVKCLTEVEFYEVRVAWQRVDEKHFRKWRQKNGGGLEVTRQATAVKDEAGLAVIFGNEKNGVTKGTALGHFNNAGMQHVLGGSPQKGELRVRRVAVPKARAYGTCYL